MSDDLALGVLLSGSGRTFENFLDEREAGRLPVDVRCVISSHADVRGRRLAEERGVPTRVLRRRDFASPLAYGTAITEVLEDHGVSLAAMAGFVHLWSLSPQWRDRVVNIHPSLLPAFGGKGFYGMNVHRAVVETGVKVTGCTVHFADDTYDTGPIIAQRCVAVRAEDRAEDVASRVFEEERRVYPEVLRWFAEGRVRREGRRVFVRED